MKRPDASRPGPSPLPVIRTEFPAVEGVGGLGAVLGPARFTGAFELSIPFELPAVQRLGPDLGLRYSSHQGNGAFGQGMALTLPAIMRDTRRGVPRYDEGDVFVHEGEKLLKADEEPSVVDGVRITRYEPRTESAFARIEHHQQESGEGAAFWLVCRADGLRRVFGKSADARVCDPADPAKVAEWWLEEEVNTAGEHVHYAYKRESAEPARQSPCYLKRVRFGNQRADADPWLLKDLDPAAEACAFELIFDYGEHADAEAGPPSSVPGETWHERPDGFSRFDAGFEIRWRRLCRRVMTAHQLPVLGASPVVVRELGFEYLPPQHGCCSLMGSVELSGYRMTRGAHERAALPPLELGYAALSLEGEFRKAEVPLPGFDSDDFQLVDLYGEGVPGVLYTDGQSHLYHRALGTVQGEDGYEGVAYAATADVLGMPAGGLASSALMDLDGDGALDIVHAGESGLRGFYAREGENGWRQFIPFSALPGEFLHPEARLADVSGNGLPDLVLISPRGVRFYANDGRNGFRAPVEVPHRVDDPSQVLPVPPGGGQTLTAFADVLGSGQQHLVRIRHDEVRVWPHLGHGRFGAARDIPLALHADITAEAFDPSRIRLADFFGKGSADLVYLGHAAVYLHLNQGGNAFGSATRLPFPEGRTFDQLDHVSVADVHGDGLPVLVLGRRHMLPEHWLLVFNKRVRPHLLEKITDNMGAQTVVAYGSSAHEWLAERKEDAAARCRLPFPVTVAKKVTRIDQVCGTSEATTLAYRQGYYDPADREFRGFGRVSSEAVATPADQVEPLRLLSWYHTGAPDGDLVKGGYVGDAAAVSLKPSRFESAGGAVLSADAAMQRALRGRLLREEVHGGAQAAAPYSVGSHRYCVRRLRVPSGAGDPVLLPFALEELDYVYELAAADPQCHQTVTMAVDAYGTATRTLRLAYPRRAAIAGADAHYRDSQQEAMHVSEDLLTVSHLPGDPGQARRLGIGIETSTQVHLGVAAPAAAAGVYDYETLSDPGGPLAGKAVQRASWQRCYYQQAANENLLPLGTATVEALLSEVRDAVMSQAELRDAFQGLSPAPVVDLPALEADLVAKGKFEFADGHYWSRGTLRHFLPLSGFFHLRGTSDMFSLATYYLWDAQHLQVWHVSDNQLHVMMAEHDPYCLGADFVRDINGNSRWANYDALGRLVQGSFSGTEGQADQNVGFGYTGEYSSTIKDVAGALADPKAAIQKVARAWFHEAGSWMGTLTPAHLSRAGVAGDELAPLWRHLLARRWITRDGRVRERLREAVLQGTPGLPHATALRDALETVPRKPPHWAELVADRYSTDADASAMQVRITVTSLNGAGGVFQRAIKAEPGDSHVADGKGGLVLEGETPVIRHSEARWIIRDRVLHIQGVLPNVVFLPCYLDSADPLGHDILSLPHHRHGYDARRRLVRALADGRERRTRFHAWHREDEDENDTAAAGLRKGEPRA